MKKLWKVVNPHHRFYGEEVIIRGVWAARDITGYEVYLPDGSYSFDVDVNDIKPIGKRAVEILIINSQYTSSHCISVEAGVLKKNDIVIYNTISDDVKFKMFTVGIVIDEDSDVKDTVEHYNLSKLTPTKLS